MTDETLLNVSQNAEESNTDIIALHGTKGKPGYELMHPKGTTGATIGTAIYLKHGQGAVEKLYMAALNAFKGGHSINESVDIAAAQSGMKQVPAFIKGKTAGFLPPGSQVYVGSTFKNNPKLATTAYAKSGDDYYSITSGGVAKVMPGVVPTLEKSIQGGVFVKGYGDESNDFNAPNPNAPSAPQTDTASPDAPTAVFVGGKPVAYVPEGSEVYVTKGSLGSDNGKSAGIAFVHKSDGNWYAYTSSSDSNGTVQSGMTGKHIQNDVDAGNFVKVDNKADPPASPVTDTKTPDLNATKPVGQPGALIDSNENLIKNNNADAKEPASSSSQNTGSTAKPGNEKANAEAEGDAGEIGSKGSSSEDLKGPDGKPIIPPPSQGMQHNQSTLQKPAPSANPAATPAVSSTQQGQNDSKKFEILADPGEAGEYHYPPALKEGVKLWGAFGSAGVMLRHTDKETGEEKFLMVQRGPAVSTNKGKWQLPGGALNSNENDYQGTARELTEELQPPDGYLDTIQPKGEVLFTHPTGWHYNNIVADVPEQFAPTVDGSETGAAKWMTHDEVMAADLHPALKSNIDAIFEQFGGPAGSATDTPSDHNSTAEKFGDAAAPPEPDAVSAALAPTDAPDVPKTAPKPVFVGGQSVGEVPADTKLIVSAANKSAPNSAAAVYALHSDGTAEVYTADGGKKLSPTAAGLINDYQKEGSYVDVDEANAANEAALNPNAPKTAGAPAIPSTSTSTSAPSALDKPDPWDTPDNPADPFGPPPTPAPDSKEPTKDVFLNGKKVGEVPETSTLYTGPLWMNDPKKAPYVYVKHTHGSLTIFSENHQAGYNPGPDDYATKYANDDIKHGNLGTISNYDDDGTPDDVLPTANGFNAPAAAKIDVGGVQAGSKDIASAINALKTGESWQVKVHLKGHPLSKMDYLSIAKDYNKEHGKSYQTKEAVIRALEDKLKKLPASAAEEAVAKGPQVFDDEPKKAPSDTVSVGGIDVTKGQLEGAISLVENGPSAYPKVNLKGHTLHGLDMANIMWQESKKADQQTKDVLLKHMKKKLAQFHEDEITGQQFVEPEEPKTPITPVKGLAQLVAEAKAAAPNEPAIENEIDLGDGVKVKPGVYKKPGGYFANITVNSDGTYSYTGSKKTGTLPISEKKFKKMFQDGFKNFVGAPEGPTGPNPEDKTEQNLVDFFHEMVNAPVKITTMYEVKPESKQHLPIGTYHGGVVGSSYKVYADGTASFTLSNGNATTLSSDELKDSISHGMIFDKYGTTLTVPGIKPADGALYHVLGSKGKSLAQLKKMRNDVAEATQTLTTLKDVYGVKNDAMLDEMTNTPGHGGIKSFALAKLDKMINDIEAKEASISGSDFNTFQDPVSGFATSSVVQPSTITGMSLQAKVTKINAISATHGEVGKNVKSFSDHDASAWLNAWYKGYMQGVYDIDSMHTSSGEDLATHPGAPGNTSTHKITWAPAVVGEVPAGTVVTVSGGHPDPLLPWSEQHINSYLVAANAQNTDYMQAFTKELWAKAHAMGDKTSVDYISLAAQKHAINPYSSPVGPKAEDLLKAAGPSVESKSYDTLLTNKTSPYDWHPQALNDFLNDKGLYNPTTGNLDKGDIVEDFLEGKKTVMVDGTLVNQVPITSKIYMDTVSSKVYVVHDDGTATKFGTAMSGKSGFLISNHDNLDLIQQGIANGALKPYNGDKTMTPAPAVPSGPVAIATKGGNSVTVDAADELYAFKSGKGEITGLYVKKPDGKLMYHGVGNAWLGKSVTQKKLDDYIANGQVKQIPNPGESASPLPGPVEIKPTYKIVGNTGLTLGNNQKTTGVVDQNGVSYVFKPYSNSELYRATHEHAANQIAGLFGYQTATSSIEDIDGLKGQLQSRHDTDRDFVGMSSSDIAKLSQDQLNSLAKEHLLDWALENPDSRPLNMQILKDGSVVGVDKGMFGKHFGDWNGLQPNSDAHLYESLAYTKLYDGIRDGKYTKEQIDSMYESVMKKARAMEQVPDTALRPIMLSNMENAHVPGGSAEDFTDKVLARKNQLRQDMDILWNRVYAMTEHPKPEIKYETLNPQGHALHSGYTSEHIAQAAKTKSYGTAAFFGGTDVEDMHAVTWRERLEGKDKFNTRGELKLRGDSATKVENWLKTHAVTSTGAPLNVDVPQVHEKDAIWHDAILKAAGNVAFHSDDGQYNVSKLNDMQKAKSEITNMYADNLVKLGESLPLEDAAKIKAQNEMALLYMGYIREVEQHKMDGTKASKAAVQRYVYTPPKIDTKEVEEAKPAVKVVKVPATRAKNVSSGNSEYKIALASDGEMNVSETQVLDGNSGGNSGYMYLVTLPTGETIEYRGNTTGSHLVSRGMTRYTIPPSQNPEVSMARIQNHMKEMGADLKPAEDSDYELYYWRHLANIMRERRDSKPSDYGKYSTFWNAHNADLENKGGPEELNMWRTAFATITNKKQVDDWVSAGNHLPQFMHYDVRNPTAATGKPYWKRFDVTPEETDKSDFLIMQSKNPEYVPSIVTTGGSLSTESRLRAFGSWLSGNFTLSSSTDQSVGSASYVFTRQGLTDQYLDNTRVLVSKQATARSHNYAYHSDSCGDIKYKTSAAPFDYSSQINVHGGGSPGNEMMIKDGVSLLDDIELMFFDTQEQYDDAVKFLKSNGINDIRGVPLNVRFAVAKSGYSGETAKKKAAIKKLKDWYKSHDK